MNLHDQHIETLGQVLCALDTLTQRLGQAAAANVMGDEFTATMATGEYAGAVKAWTEVNQLLSAAEAVRQLDRGTV